ncbi:23S rRNA (guanosine(2251)-2'-O)-methyltransferase RlmB [Cytophagaceae bacterium ABcell3]|nr:23S rRNA (guanosine(2251)-2'-O)-methyltransferase RlmB [Cytophagaceae bacterium ABcell3]
MEKWNPGKIKKNSFINEDYNDKKDIVFGIRPVIEAIHSGREIDKIFVQKDQNSLLTNELIALAQEHGIPIARVPLEKLNKITRKVHQGVICYLSAIHYASLDNVISEAWNQGKEPLLLILDRITDVRNFGAITRTAECMGVNGIVIPSRGAAQINSDALKTSAGALNFIPVCREENLKNTLTYLKDSGIQIIACTEKAEDLPASVDMKGPVAIVMGSEEDGISPEYLKKADKKVRIPMTGKVGSLNVSVAAGMILYEVVRQRS